MYSGFILFFQSLIWIVIGVPLATSPDAVQTTPQTKDKNARVGCSMALSIYLYIIYNYTIRYVDQQCCVVNIVF